MATVNLGRVSFVIKGAWSDSATYKRLDVVYSGGTSYVAKQNVPAGTAVSNTSYWQKLISSSYDLAVENGFEGTEAEWVENISDIDEAKTAALGEINTLLGTIPSDYSTLSNDVDDLKDNVSNLTAATSIRTTASGTIAHFEDAAVAPMALDIAINPAQAGSGDPGPSNVRTISGRTKVTVSRSGADTSDADEYEIALPSGAGTVYGGTLHINQDGSGVLTVDRAITTVNNHSWTYNSGASQRRFSATFSDIKQVSGNRVTPFISSVFVSIDDGRGLGDVPNNGIYGAGNSATVYIKCMDYTTEEAFKTAYGSAQIVYPLANPSTYTFTAQQISSLLGENNVWADTGDVTAEYTADTKAYIERLTQPDADWIADAGISIGKFFMVGNELYVATSGIAAGETIVPGTNCTKKSLAAALNDINA